MTDRLIVISIAAMGLLAVALILWRLTCGSTGWRLLNAVWNLCCVFTRTWHRLRVEGRERLPASGPVILASNHTTGLDPLLLQAASPRLICWVMLTSWRVGALEWLWRRVAPVFLDRGPGDVKSIRAIVRRLDQGEVIGLFPEGGLQRTTRQLNPFHPGIAMIAKRSHAVIVPAWIEGTPRRASMLWQFLQPSRSRVTFGEPYRPDPNWSRQQVLDDLRQRMEMLSQRA